MKMSVKQALGSGLLNIYVISTVDSIGDWPYIIKRFPTAVLRADVYLIRACTMESFMAQ